jgi:hypothetical protein
MKKRNIVIRYFMLLVLVATLLACASTSKQEGAGKIASGVKGVKSVKNNLIVK